MVANSLRKLAICVAALFGASVGPAAAVITDAPAPAKPSKIKVETFAQGLEHPWGMQFLPDGRLLVTERLGRMRLISKDGKLSPAILDGL
ncbi:MAG: PQQ-dependent sugar dehydrogenase, partial [Hyphomicrobium sp.]|nr:PQQ-dependent sugar dehydrogenase [Hyphomicrobium sp.]